MPNDAIKLTFPGNPKERAAIVGAARGRGSVEQPIASAQEQPCWSAAVWLAPKPRSPAKVAQYPILIASTKMISQHAKQGPFSICPALHHRPEQCLPDLGARLRI